jgi:hypothetical protein
MIRRCVWSDRNGRPTHRSELVPRTSSGAADVGGFTQMLRVSDQESVWQTADVRVGIDGGTVTVDTGEPARMPQAADAAA